MELQDFAKEQINGIEKDAAIGTFIRGIGKKLLGGAGKKAVQRTGLKGLKAVAKGSKKGYKTFLTRRGLRKAKDVGVRTLKQLKPGETAAMAGTGAGIAGYMAGRDRTKTAGHFGRKLRGKLYGEHKELTWSGIKKYDKKGKRIKEEKKKSK